MVAPPRAAGKACDADLAGRALRWQHAAMHTIAPPYTRAPGPVLDCGCCRLRPWRSGDLDALLRHADDPQVSRGLRDRFPWPYTRAHGEAFLASCQQAEGEWRLAIEVDGEAAGGIGLHAGSAEERGNAEIGYWLGRAHWGRHIARTAVRTLVAHAFQVLPLYRIHSHVHADNPASMRVLEHAGFEREGVLRAAVQKRGALLDAVVFARVRRNLDRQPDGA